MYNQQPDPALLYMYVLVSVVEVVGPILLLLLFIWLAWKVISSLGHALSPDGGVRRREQAHRHRLENMAACMTFVAFITGGVMLLLGDSGDKIGKVVFPGGVEMQNVGVPVVLLGFASSVLWMLLRAKASKNLAESSGTVNFKSARTGTRGEENIPDPMMGRGQAAQRGPTISDQLPKIWAEWTKRRDGFWERH